MPQQSDGGSGHRSDRQEMRVMENDKGSEDDEGELLKKMGSQNSWAH